MTIKASCQQLTVFWVTNCRKTRNTNRATPTAKVNIVHKGKGSNLHGYGHIRKCGSRTYFLVSHKKLGIWEPQLPSRSSTTSFAYSYHQMKRKLRCIIESLVEVQKAWRVEYVKIDKYIFAVLVFNCKGYLKTEDGLRPQASDSETLTCRAAGWCLAEKEKGCGL